MKNFKKLSALFFLSVIMLSASLASCSDDDDKKAGTLTFDVEKVEVPVGEKVTISVKDGEAPYTPVVKDKEVATAEVDKETEVITITGVSKGETTLVVTDSKLNTGTITILVKKDGIDFDKEELTLKVDAEEVVTILGGTAPYEAKVEKEDIASATIVDGENKLTVKGLKAGTTLITVIGIDKKNIGTLSVTVE